MKTSPADSPRKAAPETDREEADLIRRTLAGDRNAFEGIVRRYHGHLLRTLRGITRNLDQAEDLTQETFLRAFRALDRFDLDRPFHPWLWTIGIRLALHAIARKDRSNLSLDAEDPQGPGEGRREGGWLADPRSTEQLEEHLLRRALIDALEELEPEFRAVVVLRALEERSYEEISEILEIPKGTVMSRLFRARLRLKQKMLGWIPEGETDERPERSM